MGHTRCQPPTEPTLSRCPLCEEGHLHPRVEQRTVTYRGESSCLPMRYSVCDVCTSEVTDPDQSRANKQVMRAFRSGVNVTLAQ